MDAWAEYRAASPALRDLGLACLGAGEQVVVRQAFPARRLDSHALVIVSEGRGWHAGDRVLRVVAPAAIWVFPGVAHSYRPDPEGWTEHWVTFTGASTRAFEELGFWSRTAPVVPLDGRMPAIVGRFRELRQAFARLDRAAELEAAAVVQQLVALVSSEHGPQGRSVVDALHAAAFGRTPMPQLAAAAGLSEHEHREAVRGATGMTPLELVIQLRLSRAQALLADTTTTVRDIANAVGYDDEAYFSRIFRARVGVSPSRFREQARRSL